MNIACMMCGRDEIVDHVFWRCTSVKNFWAWFHSEFHYIFIALLSIEGPLLGDPWMIRDCCRYLWHIVMLSNVVFPWKYWCNAIESISLQPPSFLGLAFFEAAKQTYFTSFFR
jgi:hypothetical protein